MPTRRGFFGLVAGLFAAATPARLIGPPALAILARGRLSFSRLVYHGEVYNGMGMVRAPKPTPYWWGR